MTAIHGKSRDAHLRVRVPPELRAELRALARRRRSSVSQLLRSVIARELAEADSGSSSLPDESAIRETAILIAVELVVKLQEASIPGGTATAARAAVARLESVEAALKDAER
jgi:predicted transcriptional regulator